MVAPRDTRSLIFAAAKEEFAAHGIAGARMRRIAAAAGVSSERLYAYFGDKQGLYLEVLAETACELAAVPLDPFDAPGWVGRLFDHMSSHQDLVRIARWGQLEGISPNVISADDPRMDAYRQNADALREAQNLGLIDDKLSVTELYAILGALASTWMHAPLELRQLDLESRAETEIYQARREAVIIAVLRIIQPMNSDTQRTLKSQTTIDSLT